MAVIYFIVPHSVGASDEFCSVSALLARTSECWDDSADDVLLPADRNCELLDIVLNLSAAVSSLYQCRLFSSRHRTIFVVRGKPVA